MRHVVNAVQGLVSLLGEHVLSGSLHNLERIVLEEQLDAWP